MVGPGRLGLEHTLVAHIRVDFGGLGLKHAMVALVVCRLG